MSENQAQENKPLFKSGNVAVFDHKSNTTAFQVVDGEKGGTKTYTTVWKKVGNHVLSADEAGRLYLGNDVAVRVPKKNSDELFDAMLGTRGVEVKETTKEGKTYSNRTLDVGFAIPLHRKQDNALFGYKIDGVTYFKKVGSKESPVELSLREVLILSKGEDITRRDGTQIRVGEIRESNTGKSAQVFVDSPKMEVAEEEIPDLCMDAEEEEAEMPDLSVEDELAIEKDRPTVGRRI